MKTLRIFISSPGDVQQERKIAYKVISELNNQFAKYLHIEVLMWENFPLTAESTFQEGIDYFLQSEVIDFAVFILWSRMGTPLCKKFVRPDGTCYQSGTEYEFDMMMNLYKEKGWPRILTYVKQSEQAPTHLSNMTELEEYLKQKERLRSFISEHFRDEETNSNYAYLQFGENASFEHKFKEHLKTLIKPILGDMGDVREWEGNPYVGLTSFEYDQHAIFFGRRQLVYDTASDMVDFQHPETKRSLVVLGESGAGKSSFVKAGLLPFFCDNQTGENKSYRSITPSNYGEHLRQGIVDILTEHYPFLKGHPFMEEITSFTPQGKNFKHLTYSIDQHPENALLLYIDQFEELFTDSRISEEERLSLFALFKGLVSTQRIHLILSVRNDFYYVFARYEDLDWVKKNSISVDMPVMGSAEILEIVEEPAKKACLRWEVSDQGEGLNHQIVNEALAIRDLPLIEFALSELYSKRNAQEELTFAAYREIGGLEGAIAQYADRFYQGLSEEERAALGDMLAYVITKSSASNHTFVRKTALRQDIETTEIRRATLDKLIAAHLFVSGKESTGKPTVTIAHEVLLRSWKAVAEWIKNEEGFLARNTHYEEAARYWIQHGKGAGDLFKEGSKLFEAEYHHYKYGNRLSADVREFLDASFRAERRDGLSWRIVSYVAFALSVLCGLLMRMTDVEMDPTFKEWVNWDSLIEPVPLISILVYLTLPLYSIVNRLGGKPIYQTINTTFMIWSVLALVLVITDGVDASYGWLMDLPIFCYWGDKLYAWLQRRQWKKRFTPRRYSDLFWFKVKSVILSVGVIGLVFSISMFYMGALMEKNEIMEKRAETADILFRGFDNLKEQLTVSDQYYIDTLWSSYLRSNFKEELKDSTCDDHEKDYARCMINLKNPNTALKFLYPNDNWHHHLLYVKALTGLGRFTFAAEVIELYLKQCKDAKRFPYDEIGPNNYNTTYFIWTAEKAGRFDLAEQIYEQLADSIQSLVNHPANVLNRGHICLSKGNFTDAYRYYDESIRLGEELYNSDLRINLRQDMHTLSRFGVIPDGWLQQVCTHYQLDFVPAYTSHNADSLLNANCYQQLNGTWRYEDDQTIVMLWVEADDQLLTYQIYRSNDNDIVFRSNAHVRFEKKDDIIYWDEFCTDTDNNSLGMIIRMDDDTFELEVVENGNPDAKGERRIYRKVE